MAPIDENRQGSVLVWLVSCFFLVAVFSGVACLAAYIWMPESITSYYLLDVGMFLVCLPWIFWLFTFIYRCFKTREDGGGGGGRLQKGATPSPVVAAPAVSTMNAVESPHAADSPGARRVRFGGATVMGGDEVVEVVEHGSPGDTASSSSTNDTDNSSQVSVMSRECELPLRMCS